MISYWDNMANAVRRVLLYILGTTFVISAILKIIAFYSFSQTVRPFCSLLGMDALGEYSQLIAVAVIISELALGIASFVPSFVKITVFVFPLVLVWFTYITYINYIDPYGNIESCGCFGELIHFTPAESFYKNIVLLILAIALLVCHHIIEKKLN